jgi:NAD(P)-dependent dehydrogenase (short-subunit alcohol dehydrogenase family)
MLVVAVPEAAGPWWTYDQDDSSDHQGAGVDPADRRHAEETYDTLAALHPVGRMGDIGDIVEAIAYLETAEFVTGEILHVDGGQSAGH